MVGRIVLNIWRLLRKELKLPTYTQHMCCLQVCILLLLLLATTTTTTTTTTTVPTPFPQVLQRRVAQFAPHVLARWMKADSKGCFSVGLQAVAVIPPRRQHCFSLCFCVTSDLPQLRHVAQAAEANLQLLHAVGIITRTCGPGLSPTKRLASAVNSNTPLPLCCRCELSRMFGIDFMSVISRGSQFRVESLMRRLATSQNFVLMAPSKQQVLHSSRHQKPKHLTILDNSQVAGQRAMEALPLVMEPESRMCIPFDAFS